MKKTTTILIAFAISTSLLAQKGNQSHKDNNAKKEARETVLGNEKSKGKETKSAESSTDKNKGSHDHTIWEGTKDTDGGGPKASKNQPAKVRSAFATDYPNATGVQWSKYRGDWTATFSNGLVKSTAVYHANGDRKDTRTIIQQPQLPKTIIDIFKNKPKVQMGDIVKIEVPQASKNIFRIKTIEANTPRFNFFDADGKEVSYDY